jgi:general secretion pathway protein H
MKSNVKTKGFTLIEILLVIVIIVMSVSVVVSNIGTGNQTALLNGAVREMASALRFTRGHALSHSKESSFVLNLRDNTYQVSSRKKVYKLSSEFDITLDIAQSQISGEAGGGIRFFPDGSSTGGRITLELAEDKRQLDVNWLTGQVEINDF